MEENRDLRSEEVQEILTDVPHWMIRWGNACILGLVVCLLIASWIIKYPDVIDTNIVITTQHPPEKIYAKTSGQIEAIFASNKQQVLGEEVLAIIENTAKYDDMLVLKTIIDTLDISYESFYFPMEQLPLLFLGDLEPDFARFERAYAEYLLDQELNPLESEFSANRSSLQTAQEQLSLMQTQWELGKKEMALKEKDFQRFKILHAEGAISDQEMERQHLTFLQAQREQRSLTASISELRNGISSRQNDLRGTEIKHIRNRDEYLKNVVHSYNQLKRSLKHWEADYLLKASIPGKVAFLSFWDKHQHVDQGDLLFTVIPHSAKAFVGKIKAPPTNSGKLKIGQKVQVKLDNYPHMEFGMLEGNINSIAPIPDSDGNYLVDVQFDGDLVTTYGLAIEFKQEMSGRAEIITQDLRLIERITYQFKGVLN